MGNNKRMSFKKGQKSSATFPKDYVNSTDETLDEISSSESICRFPRAHEGRAIPMHINTIIAL